MQDATIVQESRAGAELDDADVYGIMGHYTLRV